MALTSRFALSYGHLDVTVVVVALPVAEAAAQLRPGLRLAPQTLTPAGTHPLVLMFGQHSHVRPFFLPPSLGGHYNEWIAATPFVEWSAPDGAVSPWATMSRLYLNSPIFTLLGWVYAYPKVLARMTVTSTSYAVSTLFAAEPIINMNWQPAGPMQPWATFPAATALAPVFGQPFIERFAPLPWLGSRMWFELGTASVQPVTLSATLDAGAAPGLGALNLSAGNIVDGFPGAFRVSLDWMMSRPYLASRFPDSLRGDLPPDCSGHP